MQRKITVKIITFLLLLTSFVSYANDEAPKGDKKSEIKEYIQHHLKDSYDFSLFSYTTESGEHKYIGMPLPVILWDSGLKVFSSSKFHHGETLAEIDGNYYKIHHEKIYKTDAEGTINYDADQHATNVKPLDFSITKSVAMILLTGLLMFFLFRGLAKSYATNGSIAKGAGRFIEPIVLYIRDDIAIPNIGGEKILKIYALFIDCILFYMVFKHVWLNTSWCKCYRKYSRNNGPSSFNVFDYKFYRNKRLLETYF